MIAFLKLIRLPNLLIIAFTQYMVRWFLIYPILKFKTYQLQMDETSFFFLSLSTVMIAAAGYIINDYFDTKIDRVNKPERLLIGRSVKRRVAMGAHVVLNLIAILIGVGLCYRAGFWKLGGIYIVWAAGLWYYSTTLKRKFLIGNLVIALFIAFVPLIVGTIEIGLDYRCYSTVEEPVNFNDIRNWVLGISVFALITTLIREMIKDIEDYEGDKDFGCRTLPIVLGINNAKTIIVTLVVITMSALVYIQKMQLEANDIQSFYYFSAFLQVPFAYLSYHLIRAKEKSDYHFASVLSKVIMVLGICYLFLFSYMLNA